MFSMEFNGGKTFLVCPRCLFVLVTVMLVGWGAAEPVDLPVATSGFGMWTDIVASAMSYGGKSQEESLETLKSFQDLATRHLHKQVSLDERRH